MTAITVVHDLASAMRAAIEDRYQTEGVDLPDRRYSHAGEVAVDCAQLVVTSSRLYPGTPAQEAQRPLDGRFMRSAELVVWLLRCVPVATSTATTFSPPSPAELDAAGLEVLTDLWLLPDAVNQAYLAGDFMTRCDNLAFVGAVPYGPAGGFGGTVATWQAQV